MRADWNGLRTRLLAGTALALLVLVLAAPDYQSELLPDDPSLIALVVAGSETKARPAPPLARYVEVWSRPLFSPDRTLRPFLIDAPAQAEEPVAFDFLLTGVLRTPNLQMAMVRRKGQIESDRVRLGDELQSAPGWRLVELRPRAAVFAGNQGQRTLELYTFDGAGGYAPPAPGSTPTRASSTPEVPAATPLPPPPPQQQTITVQSRIEARRAALRAEATHDQQ